MYIGWLQYGQPPNDGIVADVDQMALQDNSADMASTWARLFSTRVLSVIGGYTMASENLAQQKRKDALVSRVHIGSLVFITSCAAAYTILVSAVAISAFIAAHQDPRIYEYAEEISFEKQLERKIDGDQDIYRARSEDKNPGVDDMLELRGANTLGDSSRTVVAAPPGWI